MQIFPYLSKVIVVSKIKQKYQSNIKLISLNFAQDPSNVNPGPFPFIYEKFNINTTLYSRTTPEVNIQISSNSATGSWGIRDFSLSVDQCHFLCISCYGPLESNCYSCVEGYFLEESTCKKCTLGCATCSAQFDNKCLTCLKTHVFFPLQSPNGQCLPSCPPNFYLDTERVCKACDSKCSDCTGATFLECSRCTGQLYLYEKQCLPSCPQKFYENKGDFLKK